MLGVCVRRLLGAQGIVPGFEAGVALAAGVACAYCMLQFLWMAAVQLIAPTRGQTPLLLDILSQGAGLILLPHLLNAPVPWPYPAMPRVEALIYLAVFGVLHGFFKLLSFYSALEAKSAHRTALAGWAPAVVLCGAGAYACLGLFADPEALEGFRQWMRAYLAGNGASVVAAFSGD